AVFQHGDAVDPHSPGEALVALAIEAAITDDVGGDHAAAQDFQPVVALAEADLVALAAAADVDLHRRLGEGKVGGPEAHLSLVHLAASRATLPAHASERRR